MQPRSLWRLLAPVALAALMAGCAPKETPQAQTPTPAPAPAPEALKTYEGTLYIAGMGGHFAQAKVKINPAAADPIELVSLERIKLHGDKDTMIKKYANMEATVDTARNTLYFAAAVEDNGYVHVGTVDLGSGEVTKDVKVEKDKSFKKPPMYCAAAQTADHYLPVFMGYPGYIDVFDKATMSHQKRVYLNHPDIPQDYTWAHAAMAPDGRVAYLWMGAANPGKAGDFPRDNPNTYVFKLDGPALVKGELKVLSKHVVTGDPVNTAFFRGRLTPDGKYLFVAARDRAYLLDAETLKEVDVEMVPQGWEVHDVKPTPDGRYAVVSLRVPTDVTIEGQTKKGLDGMVQLYDMDKKQLVGQAVSTCMKCHTKEKAKVEKAPLCGLDAVWQ